MQKLKYLFLSLILMFSTNFTTMYAQCAMCRASVESNVSNGSNLATGLNTGIIYLGLTPYLVFAAIAYFWYQESKKRHAALKRFSGDSTK